MKRITNSRVSLESRLVDSEGHSIHGQPLLYRLGFQASGECHLLCTCLVDIYPPTMHKTPLCIMVRSERVLREMEYNSV